MVQSALNHGPGKYRELLTFSGPPDVARITAGLLLDYIDREVRDSKSLQILVAVSPDVAGNRLEADHLELTATSPSEIRLLVQIAAENPDQLTFAHRLVQFVVRSQDQPLAIADELRATRHLFSRENFGYRDAPSQLATQKPEGDLRWLLYQKVVQDVQQFPAGKREDIRNGHVQKMQAVEREWQPLLRRSFAYETFKESGLAFLATASEPMPLWQARDKFKSDPLGELVQVDDKSWGYFIVPPNSAWLWGSEEKALLVDLPTWVTDFRRRNDFFEYEVSPAIYDFMRQAFHDPNRKNILLETNGKLRKDVRLLASGLTKLALGYRVRSDSLTDQVLGRVFRKKREIGNYTPRSTKALPPRSLSQATIGDLDDELLESDRNSPVTDADLDSLEKLLDQGAEEARRLNDEAGEYITINI